MIYFVYSGKYVQDNMGALSLTARYVMTLAFSGLSWQLSPVLKGGTLAISGFFLQFTLVSGGGTGSVRYILATPG